MTKLILATAAFLTVLSASIAEAQNAAVPLPAGSFVSEKAHWRQELSSAELVHATGQCNYLVMSEISEAGGQDTTSHEDYSSLLLIKVTAWGRPFTGTDMPPKPDPKTASGHVFTVILNPTDDPREVRAEYEDLIYEKGKVKLKFSGINLLGRFEMKLRPAPTPASASPPSPSK